MRQTLHSLLKMNWPTKIIQNIFVGFAVFCFSSFTLANPSLNNVAAGDVSVQQTATTTTVNQTSQQAILNWNSFNIGANESTHFQQPAGGVALNRINPTQGASSIYGNLTATGQIILVNPAGFYFGPSAYVNVGGMVATTHNITDENFLNGIYEFSKVDGYNGAITNEGQLIAAQNGLLALVATGVRNDGTIQANVGKVVLASGEAFTMSFDGNGLVNFAIDQATSSQAIDHNGNAVASGVTNTGQIYANGGSVLVTAKAASQVLDYAINMEGIVEAKSIYQQEGEIILSADTAVENDNVVRVAGTLNASGKNAGEKGGDVTITSKYILADAGAYIDVSGDAGGGNARLGGNYLGQGPLPNATATVMAPDATINADAITNGDGGEVILWSDNSTKAYGAISTKGGAEGGNGGFIETSGYYYLDVDGISINTSAPQGQTGLWLLDPYDVIINTSSNSNGAFSGGNPNIWTPSGNSSNILVTTLESNLAFTDVTINTSGAGAQNGDISINSEVNWSSSNTLTLNPTGAVFLNAILSLVGSGSFSEVVINGDVQGGYVRADGGITITGNITTTSDFTWRTDANATYSGNITGAGKFSKQGSGDLTLTGNNTFTGALEYSGGGDLILGSANALPSSFALDINSASGTINLSNQSKTLTSISNFSGSGATIDVGSGTLTIGGTGGSHQGRIAGTGDLIVNENFSWSGAYRDDTYSGDISVNNGARLGLSVIGDTLPNVNTITVADGAYLDVGGSGTLNSGTISIIGTGADGVGALRHGANNATTVNSNILLTGNATIGQESDNNNFFFLNGVISGGFDVIFNMNTSNSTSFNSFNTITLSGANTYTGSTTVQGGSLTINNNSALSNSSSISVQGNAGLAIENGITLSDAVTLNSNNTGTSYLAAFFGDAGTVNSNITLAGNTQLHSTDTATLTIGGTINGAFDLITDSGADGSYVFNNTIGNSTPPTLLDFNDPDASVTFNTSAVTVNGNIIFGSDTSITTAGTTTFTASGASSDITIDDPLSWTTSQTVNFTAGRNIIINDAISGVNGTLQLDAANGTNTIQPSTSSLATLNVANFTILDGGYQLIDSSLAAFNVTGDFDISAADQFLRVTGGNGTSTPYQIADVFGLQGVSTLPSSDFILTADLDLNVTSTINVNAWNGGTGFAPIANYSADFDGDGFTITDLFQNISSSAGMFSSTSSSATITGVGLVNADITGFGAVGGLVGNNLADISLSYSTGSVTNTTNGSTGGLIGTSNGAIINDAYSQASVTGSGLGIVGGFIGQTGGTTSDTITRVYSTGAVSGGSNEGGLVGLNPFSSSTITNSFWDTQTSGQASSAGGTGQTTVQMQTQSTYTDAGWDFSTPVWRFEGENTYPILNAFDPVTNQILSGVVTGITSGTVTLLLDGSGSIGTSSITAGNFSISLLLGTLSGGENILFYVDNGNGVANTYTVASASNMTGIQLTANELRMDATASTASNTALINSLNAASSDPNDILFSGSIADLILGGSSGQAVSLVSTGSTTYTIDGLISTLGGVTSVINLAGPVVINGSSITTTGSQTYGGATTLSTTAALNAGAAAINLNGAVNGVNALTLTSTGAITIGSTIGNSTAPTSLTITSGSSGITINSASITTSGAQTYNDNAITLGGNLALTSTANDITGSGTINLGSNSLTISNVGSSSSLSGVISGTNGQLIKVSSGTLTISGANTYTGDTTINAGTLALGASNVISNSSDLVLADVSGAIFDLGNFGDTIGGLSGGGTNGGDINFGGSGSFLTVSQTENTTFSGDFTGSSASTFNKSSSGTLTLAGSIGVTFSGADIRVNSGTLQLGANNVINGSNQVFIDNGATFDLNNFSDTSRGIYNSSSDTTAAITLGSGTLTVNESTDSLNFYGIISGTGNLIKDGSSSWDLYAVNTYTGSTTVNGGSLDVRLDTIDNTSSITVANGATLRVSGDGAFGNTNTININGIGVSNLGAISVLPSASAGSITFSNPIVLQSDATLFSSASFNNRLGIFNGVISGSGNLTTRGVGITVLGGSNTYTGSTTASDGFLRLGAAGVIPDASSLLLSGDAQLDLNDFNETIGSLSGDGATDITLGSGILTITQDSDQTFSGIISGTGSIVKAGTNVLTLSGTNTYSGGTTINAGTLSISSDANLGADPGAPTAGHLTLAGGTLLTTAGFTLDSDRGIALGTGGGTIDVNTGTLSYGGIIAGANTLTKAGAGTFLISGVNTYTGDTNLNAGTFQIGASNLINNTNNFILSSGATFNVDSFNETIGALSGAGGTVSLNGGTFTTSFTGSQSYAGDTSGDGTFQKESTGIWTVSGSIGHTGELRIQGGTLRLASSDRIADTLPVFIDGDAVFDLNNFSETTGVVWNSSSDSGASVLLGAASTLTIQSGSVVNDFYGVISGAGNIVKSGANPWDLRGVNTYTGSTTVSQGKLLVEINSIDNSSGVSVNAGTSFEISGNSTFGNTNAITLADTSTLILEASSASTVTTSNNIVATGDVTIRTNFNNSGVINGVISGNANIDYQASLGTGTIILGGTNTYTGNTILDGDVTLQLAASNVIPDASNVSMTSGTTLDLNDFNESIASLSGAGDIDLGAGALTVNQGSDQTFSGIMSGTGNLIKTGANTLTLTGANTYSGATTISAGTLQLDTGGSLSDSTAVTANATFDFNNISDTIGSLAGSGSVLLGSGTLTTGDANNTTFSGVISETGTLVKQGAGIFTLSGANTYTGTTTISAGTLQLSGAGRLSDSTAVTANATLDLNDVSDTIASLAGSGSVLLGSGTLTTGDANNTTFSGVISETGSLVKQGAGIFTLSGNNTFGGGVTLTEGTLTLGHNSALGTGALILNGGSLAASSTRTLSNSFIVNASSSISGSSNFTFNGTGTLNNNLAISSSAFTTFSGVLSGTGNITQSSGTVTLSGTNTYSGTTTINGGTLNANSNDALGATSGSTIVNNGGTLAVNSSNLAAETITLNDVSTLTSTGTSSLSGAITLGNSASSSISAGGTLTISGNINGAGDLTLSGAGNHVVSGNIGNSTAISSLTTSAATAVGGSVATTNNQTYGSPISLNSGSGNFTSNSGAIAFNSTLNGGQAVTINSSSGATTFGGIVGGGTALSSLDVTSSSINVNGGAINTVGNQAYNGLVTLGATTNLTTSGTGSVSIALNNGVAGGQNLTMTGAATANESFVIAGSITANNITINGGAGGTNTLSVDTSGSQTWTLTAANNGNISGIAGVAGNFNFANISHLTGGSGADSFILNGGTLAGNVIGGSGSDTLTADDLTNSWNITSANAGNVTGITGTFSGIENLVGGDGFANDFVFANGATISGSIDGGTIPGTDTYRNTLDFDAYTSLVTVNLVGNIFTGNVKNSSNGSIIGSYSNINELVGDDQLANVINLPSGKTFASHVTTTGTVKTFGSFITYNGFIGDPTWFFAFGFPAPAPDPTPDIPTNAANTDVAQIVQQPQDNVVANQPVSESPAWVDTSTNTNNNMTEMSQQADDAYREELEDINVDPFCGFGG